MEGVEQLDDGIEALDQLSVECERLRHELDVMSQKLDDWDNITEQESRFKRLFRRNK